MVLCVKLCFLYFFCINQTYNWHVLSRFWPAVHCLPYKPQVCCYTEMLINKSIKKCLCYHLGVWNYLLPMSTTDPFPVVYKFVVLQFNSCTFKIFSLGRDLCRVCYLRWLTQGHISLSLFLFLIGQFSCAVWPQFLPANITCPFPRLAEFCPSDGGSKFSKG